MKKNSVKTNDLTFKEEVPDEELHSKLGVDDHIYITRRHIFGFPFLVLFSVVLGLSLLFSVLFSYIYVNSDKSDRPIGVINTKYNLVISHSNENFGGIVSFNKYNSEKNAFEYAFNVSNANDIDLKYSVELINNAEDLKNIDMSLINYQLIRNDKVIEKGTLDKEKINTLYKTSIKSASIDMYKVKLWSTNLNNKKFDFKINVGV